MMDSLQHHSRRSAAFLVAALASVAVAGSASAQTFSESIGAGSGSTNPSVSVYTGYQNTSPVSFNGNADVRVTTPSSGYGTASGGANVFFGTAGSILDRHFSILGINTTSFSSRFLSFGVIFTSGASNTTPLTVEVGDGGASLTTTVLTLSATPTTSWAQVSATTQLPSSSNLVLHFYKNGQNTYRVDDILIGAAPSAPTSSPALSLNQVKGSVDSSIFTNTSGTVVNVGGSTGRLQFTIADAAGNGLLIDKGSATYTQPNVGDFVNITSGTKTTFSGLIEFQPADATSVVTTAGGGTIPAPQELTVATLNPATSASLLQGNYARIKNLHSIDTPTSAGATTWLNATTNGSVNFVYANDSGSTLTLRVPSDLHATAPTWQGKTRPATGDTHDRVDVVSVITAFNGVNQLQLSDPSGTTAKIDANGPIRAASDPLANAARKEWNQYE